MLRVFEELLGFTEATSVSPVGLPGERRWQHRLSSQAIGKSFRAAARQLRARSWLLYVSMASVVHLFHVDLGHKHQVAGVVLLALIAEVVLLGISSSSQVLHLAP